MEKCKPVAWFKLTKRVENDKYAETTHYQSISKFIASVNEDMP